MDRLATGGDDDYRFPPQDFPNGNPILGGESGSLGKTIHPFVRDGEFGVGTGFVGARVLAKGTKGKGGLLPTIVPKTASALFLPLSPAGRAAVIDGRVMPGALDRLQRGKDFKFVRKVDIRPRAFVRMSRLNLLELIRTFIKS